MGLSKDTVSLIIHLLHSNSLSLYTTLYFATLLHYSTTMYSKIVCGLVMTAGAAHGAHVLTRRDGAHAHPAPAPADGYGEPPATYGAPAPSYEEPSYSPPAYESYDPVPYEEEGGFDLATLIITILVIVGLSLLFPVTVNVPANGGGGRKKRDVDTSSDVIERVNEIYTAVVQSEECMEKIA